jgi:hypothetical protein
MESTVASRDLMKVIHIYRYERPYLVEHAITQLRWPSEKLGWGHLFIVVPRKEDGVDQLYRQLHGIIVDTDTSAIIGDISCN